MLPFHRFEFVQIQYMTWSFVFAISPICLSSLVIVLTVITIIVLIRNIDTTLVRASGNFHFHVFNFVKQLVCTYKWYQFYNLELIYVLLTFILICLSNTFHLLGKPGITSCILQQFGVGLGFSVVSGALLTKPISCLAFLSAYRPNFVFPDPIVGVQIFATIIW